jgi:hypothetical protein
MPYDVCSNIITCNCILGGGSRMLIGGSGDHGGYSSSHNQKCHAGLWDSMTRLDSYNDAVAVIDGQIQKIKVRRVAMFFALCAGFTTRVASICLLLKSPATLPPVAKVREAFKEAVQRRLMSERLGHQEDFLIATTLDVRYAPCLYGYILLFICMP